MNNTLVIRNARTGSPEAILQRDVTLEGWGLCFFVNNELDAYKAAYKYQHNPYGVEVKFAHGVGQWMVTVFNEHAKAMGIGSAR